MKSRMKIMMNLCKKLLINKKFLGIILLFKLISLISAVAYPFIYRYYIEVILTEGKLEKLWYVNIGFICLMIVNIVCEYANVYATNRFFNKMLLVLRGDLLNKYINSDIQFYKETPSGELKMMIDDDVNVVRTFMQNQLFNNTFYVAQIVVISGFMFYINYRLSIISLIFFGFSFVQGNILKKKVKDNALVYRNALSNEVEKVKEDLYLWREIKSLNIEDKVIDKFKDIWENLTRYVYRQRLFEYLNYYFSALNNILISRFFIYMFGGLMIIFRGFSISSFLIFVGFYELFIGTIGKLTESNLQLEKDSISINRILFELDRRKDGDSLNVMKFENNTNSYNSISVKDITFTYTRDTKPLFEDYSVDFVENKKYVIQGPSGRGKSTLLKLICDEYRIQSGTILINGIDIHKNMVQNLYDEVTVMSQDYKLFNTTIRENLLFANYKADEKDMDAACANAEILDFINGLPKRYDTVIGENGLKISGGQRQRLALARVFLKNSSIYILDEATSAIGSDMENRIIKRLLDEKKESLFLIVSHRELTLDGLEFFHVDGESKCVLAMGIV